MLNFKPKAVESPQSAVRTCYAKLWFYVGAADLERKARPGAQNRLTPTPLLAERGAKPFILLYGLFSCRFRCGHR